MARDISLQIARIRAAGARVGHVVGHDVRRMRFHYSITVPYRAVPGLFRSLENAQARPDRFDPRRVIVEGTTASDVVEVLTHIADILQGQTQTVLDALDDDTD